jgi:hypothetical protein
MIFFYPRRCFVVSVSFCVWEGWATKSKQEEKKKSVFEINFYKKTEKIRNCRGLIISKSESNDVGETDF